MNQEMKNTLTLVNFHTIQYERMQKRIHNKKKVLYPLIEIYVSKWNTSTKRPHKKQHEVFKQATWETRQEKHPAGSCYYDAT